MGFYIETPGITKGKARHLLDTIPGAMEIIEEEAESYLYDPDNAVVCVVENPVFDAAGFIYDKREFTRSLPRWDDARTRRWLVLPRKYVEERTRFGVEAYAEYGIVLRRKDS